MSCSCIPVAMSGNLTVSGPLLILNHIEGSLQILQQREGQKHMLFAFVLKSLKCSYIIYI